MDNLTNKLAYIVENSWLAHCADHFSCEVALSGGVDSVVLLHLLCCLRDKNPAFDLSAVHIHHGLQKVADAWGVFCQNLCDKWQIPLTIQKVKIDKRLGLGVEAAARNARYEVFSGSLKPVIALAHHQNDQIETFFLSVLRGGGVRGMSAMPEVRFLHDKILWRPLLNISRQEIELYAKNNNLPFIEDPTNTDPTYTRNYLRHFWLPEIENKIPHFARQIESNIKQLQNALAILDEVAADDLAQISPQHGVLDLHKLSKLSAPRRLEVLYLFIKNNQLQMPERHCLETFAQQLFRQPEKYGELKTPLGFLYAQYGFLWAVPNHFSGSLKTEWQTVNKGLPDEIIGTLTCRKATKCDTIRTKIGHKSVWKLLQEKKIPQFIRRQWLVWVDEQNQCIAVANVRIDETLAIKNGKMPVVKTLQRFFRQPENNE
ncbi:MAG: tRNA lysidine(34) synthetase TilS [Neisseriaceae bacterium]|nr:tRNA lysidine(34) synthetase TilS [Neisseriaceae bacterium]